MVNQFHAASIELILDVVYNHTAEGNELGPTLSAQGIDNATIAAMPDEKRYYINDTGTGNTVNLRPARAQMVADSLRYWATEMQVMASASILPLFRHANRMGSTKSGFLDARHEDPVSPA